MAQPEIGGSNLALSRESFDRFAQFIMDELGIKMSPAKVPMLQGRLMRRLRHLNLDSLDAYQDYLFHSPQAEEERVHFINAVTTNKTDFFREPQHFEFLVKTAMPELARLRSGPQWPFRLWCAGCSSGEEVYTQAIVLSEYAQTQPGFTFRLLATDISTRVLEHAECGIYDEERIAPIAMPLRQKYLLRSKNPARRLVRVAPSLRRAITFHRLNFMDEHYAVRTLFEVIFIRNVLIYFDKPTQEKVIQRLCRNLKPGGYLFTGHSESLSGLNVPVTSVGTAVYRKAA